MCKGKEAAAQLALEKYLGSSKYIGIGSGTTIIPLVKLLGEKNKDFICVPTSFQSEILLRENHIRVSNLQETPRLDVVFDGADEITPKLDIIKGGGGCLLQEKIVASCTNNFVVIAAENKVSNFLGEKWNRGIPIEVIPMSWSVIRDKVKKLYGGSPELRMAINKMGPVVTDNGNFLIDWKFDPFSKLDYLTLNAELNSLPGVVETGLFINYARVAVIGREDGTAYEINQ